MNEHEMASLQELEQLALELEVAGDDRVAILRWAYDIVAAHLNEPASDINPEYEAMKADLTP